MANLPTRTATAPLIFPRTIRPHETRVLTSFKPGKMCPIAAIPLLREDAVRSSAFRFSFELQETAEILMNAVEVRVKAYLVPNLALERFESLDQLNRSYAGEEWPEGSGSVTPYIETEEVSVGVHEIYNAMGLHARQGDKINTAYRESYNAIWNYRAANRSPDITPRALTDTSLAPAFWNHAQFNMIVPDYDDALVEGDVPLSFAAGMGQIPVSGIGFRQGAGTISAGPETIVSTAFPQGETGPQYGKATDNNTVNYLADDNGLPAIYAELAGAGISLSLANFDLARKTAAFARLRTQYTGHTDEWIIDLLMDGIHIPEQEMKQPILIAQGETIFGMSKRYATDAPNLTESVVNGATFVDLRLAVPRVNVGGMVMFVAEVTPEQLWERQRDPYFNAQGVDDLPHALRDSLDPEPVSVVPNDFVDIDHDNPKDVFGYAPLNYEWMRRAANIGGKFYRPEVDAGFDEDRQRIWAAETKNPTLSSDFYLTTNLHEKVFVTQNIDQVECVMQGGAQIEGDTQFGPKLLESTDDYDKVMEQAPLGRIDKDATSTDAAAPVDANALGTDQEGIKMIGNRPLP